MDSLKHAFPFSFIWHNLLVGFVWLALGIALFMVRELFFIDRPDVFGVCFGFFLGIIITTALNTMQNIVEFHFNFLKKTNNTKSEGYIIKV